METKVRKEKATKLKLVETNWKEIKEKGISTVYVQSKGVIDMFSTFCRRNPLAKAEE